MRTVKIIVGIGCFVLALYLGLVVLHERNIFSNLPLATSSLWLVGIGSFLVVRRNRAMSGGARIRFALTFCLCVGFILSAGIANFIRVRSTSAFNACINNLRQIDAAANQFALDHNLTNGLPINFPNDLTPYIKLNNAGKIHGCPQGGIYHVSKVGETPTCSLGTTVTPAHVLP
jgi:thiol:disulfide interchange protein